MQKKVQGGGGVAHKKSSDLYTQTPKLLLSLSINWNN